ncbi:MAG TPA: (d)CMP kinase, partial [Gemmatimonadaceae bacterium]|nr:(d)CMP kinase [Gemmatimonadaceae bacterium]
AVFPDAALKVWLVASARERARRRSVEILGRPPAEAELAAEAAALVARDERDARQTQPAADAIELDTTRMTQPEQVARIVELARERLSR